METKTFWVEGDETPYSPDPSFNEKPVAGDPPIGTSSGYPATNTSYNATGAAGGTYTHTTYGSSYAKSWVPYKSRFTNPNTRTTFHVMFDPRVIQEGDRVVIIGNLVEMVRRLFVIATHIRCCMKL